MIYITRSLRLNIVTEQMWQKEDVGDHVNITFLRWFTALEECKAKVTVKYYVNKEVLDEEEYPEMVRIYQGRMRADCMK